MYSNIIDPIIAGNKLPNSSFSPVNVKKQVKLG